MSANEKDIIQKSDKSRFLFRLKLGLKKTRDSFSTGLIRVVSGSTELGPELWQELEEVLLTADMGMPTITWIMEELKKGVKGSSVLNKEEIIKHLKKILLNTLEKAQVERLYPLEGPSVVMMIGVNGSGKTTTIGKLAARYKGRGEKVILVAGDTFRAAATEQLQVWAQRIDAPCIFQKNGTDPSAVAYDAVQSAVVKKMDRVFVDTAGRLQTNKNLMEELKKIKRVVKKVIYEAPHEILLVLDASIGQNSLSQARLFNEALGVDGIVMTKLDGSSKGGVLFSIARELKLPVRFIGVGEQVDDLQPFDPQSFVDALFD
ncbi:MAG: signal recognition particle-docking protein FtsY [Nitrospina sp.]|jgi:fused signal recognition particle receptor|nr:signal recognition particle-docking protein FtsY [Nitrospina sp.]MBT6600879.1 signal recognition particle-docking protein FtsY [Nitrospina sp.]